MTSRLNSASTSSGDNQPIDLAQKPQGTRITDTTKGGTATFVHFTSNSPSNVVSNLAGIKNDNGANVATLAVVSRHPSLSSQNTSSGALNLAKSKSSVGFNTGGSSGMVRSVANSTSTSLTMVSASSTSSPVTVPSGYHIPRGAAVVANMTASRSQNLASIVKTTPSQPLGISNSSSIVTPRSGLVTQRVVPISTNNWIGRSSSTTAVLTSKVSTPQSTGRATITTARPAQSPVMPTTTYHSGTMKPGAIVSANIRSPVTTGVRIGASSEGIRPHTPKGLQITHPVSHVGPKFIGTGVGGTVRGVNASAITSPGGGSALYSPTSTLVTSLASSGTTITPHPGNRSQVPPSTLRITSASAFSQVSSLSTPPLCGISLTSPTGAILNPHQASRGQSAEHHLPIKTPVVRAPYSANQPQGIKGNSTTLPAGTQISFSGPKMIAHSSQGSSLAVTQISNVAANHKTGAAHTTAQSASNAPSFQSRTVTAVGPNIGKLGGPAISMTKVIPKSKIGHKLNSPSISTGVGTHSPSTIASNLSADAQTPHTSVFLHRSQHSGTAVGLVTQPERIVTTVPQYSLSTHYLESQNQGSYPVNASLVPYSINPGHYIPTAVTTGAIQVGGNVVSSIVTSESSMHQSTIPIMKSNSSPRPSILRKRADMDGSPLKAAKNLTAALNLPISSPPSPKRPDSRGNGNASSGSTTISANSSPGMQILEEDPNVCISKTSMHPGSLDEDSSNSSCLIGSPMTSRSIEASLTTGNRAPKSYYSQLSDHYLLNVPQTMEGVSPRKKPRKQQLMGNELQESPPCEEEIEPPVLKKRRDFTISQPVQNNMEGEEEKKPPSTWLETPEVIKAETPREASSSPDPVPKRPHMSLINSYRQSWKPRHNHFARHSDLRPKEEKKRTVNEIASQKMAMQRVNGWKVMHISGQVEDLVDLESEVANRLRVLLKTIEKRSLSRKPFKDFDKDVDKLSELVKANIQRSIIIKDQMADAKFQMSRLFDHKDNVVELLTKYSNKRILRKKDKI